MCLRFESRERSPDGIRPRKKGLMKTLSSIAALAVTAILIVPVAATAAVNPTSGVASDIAIECGVNPSTQTVEQWFRLTPPDYNEEMADFVPFPDGTEDAQRAAHWAEVQANWTSELADWEQSKAADQSTYNSCAARIKREEAADARERAREQAADKRARAEELAAARHRCRNYGAIRIWKSRPAISCSTARSLARVHRSARVHAGWHRTAYKQGFDSFKLVTTEDANHELHTYRVPTLPYMQATWRKGTLRVVVESGHFCEDVC